MRPFRFRTQIVLELRRREEEAARAALGRHQAARARAQAMAEEAVRTVRTAGAALTAAVTAGASPALVTWHRSWIGKLRGDVAARAAAAVEAELATVRASAALGKALQRLRVLERLRDRAWRRYQVESDREQLRDMDRLAGLRHFAQAADFGGEQ